MLTLDWQTLSTRHGYAQPDAIAEAGASEEWAQVMRTAAELHDELVHEQLATIAPYAVPMAYRVRFFMELNAREAMHMIELRTSPQRNVRTDEGLAAIFRALGLIPQLAHESHGELDLFDRFITDAECVGNVGLDGHPDFRREWRHKTLSRFSRHAPSPEPHHVGSEPARKQRDSRLPRAVSCVGLLTGRPSPRHPRYDTASRLSVLESGHGSVPRHFDGSRCAFRQTLPQWDPH